MESLHYLLMKTHSLFTKRVMTEASRAGLTSGQPKVLEYLAVLVSDCDLHNKRLRFISGIYRLLCIG